MSAAPRPPGVRFWLKVDKTAGDDGCWLWTGSTKPNGYGQFGVSADDRSHYAHRFAWEITRGDIPEGLTIDHLCRVRRCVNVRHMEVVTRAENYRRAVAARTHCPNGHEYVDGSYDLIRGARVRRCLACAVATMRASSRRIVERERAARAGVNRKYLLTDAEVAAIREEVAAGASRRMTAEKYGCSQQHVDKLVTGQRRTRPANPADIIRRAS